MAAQRQACVRHLAHLAEQLWRWWNGSARMCEQGVWQTGHMACKQTWTIGTPVAVLLLVAVADPLTIVPGQHLTLTTRQVRG
jgi:hypothetical protein